MKKYALSAHKRTITGKKVKELRKEKQLVGNIFGKKMTSLAVQLPEEVFAKVYKEAGETGLVELSVDGQMYPVLIKQVQMHPVTQQVLHVDFHQVDLKEKVTAHIPIELVGVAPAVSQKIGLLLELLDEIEVEALPTDLPEKIQLDISKLTEVGMVIKVADLKLATGVTIVTGPETEIVKVGELISKEAEALAKEEAAAQAAAEAEAQAAAPTTTETVPTLTTPPPVAAPAKGTEEKK